MERTGEPAASAAEEAAFAARIERHRRELHIHSYRMLASFDDAEDAVQETFLRAWRRPRAASTAAPVPRAWLYRIATNVCLDLLRRTARRVHRAALVRRDALAPALPRSPAGRGGRPRTSRTRPPSSAGNDRTRLPRRAAGSAAETARGADRSRPAGVAGRETASLLETSVAAANSAAPAGAGDDAGSPSVPAPGLVRPGRRPPRNANFLTVHRRPSAVRRGRGPGRRGARHPGDHAAVPVPVRRHRGVAPCWSAVRPGARGRLEAGADRANRMPTAASYLRRFGDSEFRAFKFDVLRIEDGAIAEITTFGPGTFRHLASRRHYPSMYAVPRPPFEPRMTQMERMTRIWLASVPTPP